jgi:hypothetical protein
MEGNRKSLCPLRSLRLCGKNFGNATFTKGGRKMKDLQVNNPPHKCGGMIDKESLKMLDESLVRGVGLWDSSHISGWDHAFDVISTYMARKSKKVVGQCDLCHGSGFNYGATGNHAKTKCRACGGTGIGSEQ